MLRNIYREEQVVDRLNDSEITVNVSSVFLHYFICLSFLLRSDRVSLARLSVQSFVKILFVDIKLKLQFCNTVKA